MSNIIQLKRRVRPLRKTYQPTAPYVVERMDREDGAIVYEVVDERPDSYRTLAYVSDDEGRNPYAKFDAEQIARGLNLLVQYGKETLPKIKNREDFDMGEDEDDDFRD